MEKKEKIIRYSIYVILALLVLVEIAAGFLIFCYSDILDTFDNSVLLGETIKNGKFLQFYKYSAENMADMTVYSANYNILMYVIFAIWNLPTIIKHLNTGFEYLQDVSALLWCKGIILVGFFAMSAAVYKILKFLKKEKKDIWLCIFIMLSSACLFLSDLCASQYDCIMIALELWGVYFYLKNKDILFVLFFALAIPLKLFSVFIFLPLLCIKYKNILKIGILFLIAYLPNYLLSLPFKGDIYYSSALESQNKDAVKLLFNTEITGGKISWFIVIYIIICVWCYLKKFRSKEEKQYFVLYICFAIFGAFVTLTPIRSYWLILLTPFVSIIILQKKEYRFIGILLDTIGGISIMLYYLMNHWIYSAYFLCQHLIFERKVFENGLEYKYDGISDFMTQKGLMEYKDLFFWIFVVSILLIAVFYFPGKIIRTSRMRKLGEGKSIYVPEVLTLIARPLSLILITTLLVSVANKTQQQICFGDDVLYQTIDTEELQTIESKTIEVKFGENKNLIEFGVLFEARAVERRDRSMLHFELIDKSDGKNVWTGDMPVCLIEDDKYNKLEMDGVEVLSDREYEIKITTILPDRRGASAIYLKLNDNNQPAIYFR